jgi:hypothetical protein
MVSKPAAQRFVLTLKSTEFLQQVEYDFDAREINAQALAEAVDHAQPRDICHVKEEYLVSLPNGLNESEIHKSLG